MAAPILPVGTGIGPVKSNPINVGGLGSAEAAFRKDAASGGMLGKLLDMYPTQTEAINARKSAQSGILQAIKNLTSGSGSISPNLVGAAMDGSSSFFSQPENFGAEFSNPNNIFEPDELAYDQNMSGGVNADAMGQILGGMKREQFPTRTDSFQQTQDTNQQELPQELTTGEISGGAKPQTNTSGVEGADTPAKQAAVTALDEYLKAARPGVAPKDYAEYIKEFGEATGLDVSGEPDNKTALMAFGLALMQNKAGKGFDVGKILSSVGEAGEKAMPALEKARANAKAIRAKAGEYALGRKKEDQAAAMKREQFYIIPKGKLGGPLGVVDAITKGKGEFADLNSYELNNLNTNEEFNSQYEIVKASDYSELVKEALKTPEAKKIYQKGSQGIPLFSGATKDLELLVQLPDRNVSTTAKPVLLSDPKQALQQISRMEKGLARGEELFTTIGGLLNQTDTSIPAQARKSIVQGLRNLGFDAGGETDPVKQIQVMLTKLKAQNAAEILGESGKTLSDNDRRMVSEIVGDISFTEGDEALLIQKLGMLYKDIIGTRRNEIEEAYSTLGNYANIKRGNSANSGLGFTKGDDGVYRRQQPPTNQ